MFAKLKLSGHENKTMKKVVMAMSVETMTSVEGTPKCIGGFEILIGEVSS